MNETIKLKMKAKYTLYKKIQNGRFESDFSWKFNNWINELTSSTKASYYENLGKKILQAKTYSSIPKTFSNDKKTQLISSRLVDHNFITDIKTKANIFNKFFGSNAHP